MKNRFKWSLLAVIALIATVAMAADKYISSSGNIVLKTAASKSVNLQDTVYATQAGSVGIGISGPQSKLDVYTNQASFAGIRVYNDSSDSAAKGGIGFGDHNGSYQNQIYTNAAGKLFIDNLYTNGMEIRANTVSSPVSAVLVNSTGKTEVLVRSDNNCGIGNVCSGEFTPGWVCSAGANCQAASNLKSLYLRVGNVVTVSANVTFDSAGGTTTIYICSLPGKSNNFADNNSGSGSCINRAAQTDVYVMQSPAGSSCMKIFNASPAYTSAENYECHFTYQTD